MRQRLSFDRWPAAIYAIGDVHGCLLHLLEMERRIVVDAAAIDGEKWIVTLGDHIDRGPKSAGVLDHLLAAPPAGFKRFALLGNHEEMMLEFLADPLAYSFWLDEGGAQTLMSYGIDLRRGYPDGVRGEGFAALLAEKIPREHIATMRQLPISLSLPGWVFVHAGVALKTPFDRQTDHDMVWSRVPFEKGVMLDGAVVVHGHTPVREPFATPHRIDVDTGCFRTGRLSAVRVTPDGATKFFSVTG
jgi:serine/threonine protein phosphatase 1